MDCAECERLRAERERRTRDYELASLYLSAAATSTDSGRFMILKTLAEEARLDLDLVDTEIEQHRNRHTRTTAQSPGSH